MANETRISKPNFQVTAQEDGKKYWISRAVAVCVVIYCYTETGPKDGKFLLHTRGYGTPDYQGCVSTNCGYLDGNEYLKEAACREVWQELGLKIYPDQIEKLAEINDTMDGPQNVTVRFLVRLPYAVIKHMLDSKLINNSTENRGGEVDEVGKIFFIDAKDIVIPSYESSISWAFGHDKLLREVWNRYIRVGENDFNNDVIV